METKETNKMTDAQVAEIAARAEEVAIQLGCMRGSYSPWTYDDSYIAITHWPDPGSVTVNVKMAPEWGGHNNVVVFEVETNRSKNVSAQTARPGRWMDHLARLALQARQIVEDRRAAMEAEEAARFAPVDDREVFEREPAATPAPDQEPEPSLADKLHALIAEIVREELSNQYTD